MESSARMILGNYVVIAEGKAYRVLLASVTYFKAEPGDEVTVVVPRDSESVWGAIENLVKKGAAGRFCDRRSLDGKRPEEKEEEKIVKDNGRQYRPGRKTGKRLFR